MFKGKAKVKKPNEPVSIGDRNMSYVSAAALAVVQREVPEQVRKRWDGTFDYEYQLETMTFTILVRAERDDGVRVSVTKVVPEEDVLDECERSILAASIGRRLAERILNVTQDELDDPYPIPKNIEVRKEKKPKPRKAKKPKTCPICGPTSSKYPDWGDCPHAK